MNNPLNPQQAIRDLELIRTILAESEHASTLREKGSVKAYDSQIIILSGTLAIVAGFALLELSTEHINTRFLLASSFSEEILKIGLTNLSLMLLIGLAALYYVVFWAAKSSELSFSDYLKHHFTYLRSFSFAADLVIKFIVISLLLVAKRPEWVAPMLTLFTADYLFQRRFFVLPVRGAMVLGVICLFVSGLQFYYRSPILLWSLICFFVIGLISLYHVLTNKKAAGI